MRFEDLYMFIYIDALQLEYVNPKYMPNLFGLLGNRENVIHVLQNIPGYSFGIQSTLLSGLLPQETLHWMPYMFKTEKIERYFDYLKSPCDYNPLVCNALIQKVMSSFRNIRHENTRLLYEGFLRISVFWRKKSVKLCGMPMDHLGKILIFPYYYMNENPFFFMFKKELEERSSISVDYLGHSLRKNIEGLSRVIRMNMGRNSRLFILGYIDDLDGVGHEKGVASSDWFNTLKSIDFFIGSIYKKLTTISKNVKILLFSDHGMCNADEYIDLESLLRHLPKGSIDFFIDATLAFICVHNETYKELVVELLKRKLKDKVLIFDVEKDKHVLKHYGVYFANGEYGNIIVQTKPCKEFLPNFYSVSRGLKGLHGFWPTEALQRAFILSIPSEDEFCKVPLHIKDVKGYILNQLYWE